jgi:hypothetical protein
MAHHARRLIETMLRIHALVPWDDVPSDEPFAFQIPGRDVPVVASFAFDGPARGLLLCEGGLDGWSQSMCGESDELGAEIALLVAPLRTIPRKHRAILEAARWHGRRDAPALLLMVKPVGRGPRNARPKEIRTSLYAATAFLKAWKTGRLVGERGGIPLLKLSGAPHDPTIEWDHIDWVETDGPEITPMQFGPIELPTRLRSESPRATDATWSIGSYPVPPLIENSGLEFTALALVDGASGELLHSDLVASPCLNRAVESIRGYADGACPGVPAVIRVRAGNEIDERILAALRPLFEPHGVACRTEPRLPELDSVIEEAQRSTAEFRLRLERRNRD